MIAGAHEAGEPRGLLVEVDPISGRAAGEPRTLEDDQLEPVGKAPPLRGPGRPPARDAAVHEQQTLHEAILTV